MLKTVKDKFVCVGGRRAVSVQERVANANLAEETDEIDHNGLA
jgi:hypothetical protein